MLNLSFYRDSPLATPGQSGSRLAVWNPTLAAEAVSLGQEAEYLFVQQIGVPEVDQNDWRPIEDNS